MDQTSSRPSKRPRFFIENLLSDEQPILEPENTLSSKYSCFTIDHILGLREDKKQYGGGNLNPDKYVKKLNTDVIPNKKFQLLNRKTRFSITNIPADPEALLLGIFQYCIDEAIEECNQRGMNANQVGVTISSELLDLGDVWTPVRPINENITEALLNLFLKVAQSKNNKV